jgi:hypothetical protein
VARIATQQLYGEKENRSYVAKTANTQQKSRRNSFLALFLSVWSDRMVLQNTCLKKILQAHTVVRNNEIGPLTSAQNMFQKRQNHEQHKRNTVPKNCSRFFFIFVHLTDGN